MHNRFKRRDQPAGRVPDGSTSVTLKLVNVGLTISNYHHLFPLEMSFQCQFEALCCPGSAFEFRLSLYHNPINQVADISDDRPKFRAFWRLASGQAANLLAPTLPRKARSKNRDCGIRQRKKAESKKHESLRFSFSALGIAKIMDEDDEGERQAVLCD